MGAQTQSMSALNQPRVQPSIKTNESSRARYSTMSSHKAMPISSIRLGTASAHHQLSSGNKFLGVTNHF